MFYTYSLKSYNKLFVILLKQLRYFMFAISADEMETITMSPFAKQKPDPEVVNELIMDLESRRTSTMFPTQARLSLIDSAELCEAFGKDEDVMRAMHGIRGFHFIPVYPIAGTGLPDFEFPCFGWIRKNCVGIAKPPFDYRCHYWSPYYVAAGAECGAGKRKRRSAGVYFEPVVVSGTEALTLCSTAGQLPKSNLIEVDTVALPTNEASGLRCMNWRLFPDGKWVKQQLPKVACEQFNVARPAGYVMNEINEAVIEDLFSEIITCGSRGRIIDCVFIKHNVRDPST
ncbi:unnamed protein product [Orchesella dallaii]|uniref:Uncharacterized protein n=1 Tax=Orchesella dallaii TaxID=48710 RepID=A0ABP1QAB7_9HEXA